MIKYLFEGREKPLHATMLEGPVDIVRVTGFLFHRFFILNSGIQSIIFYDLILRDKYQ